MKKPFVSIIIANFNGEKYLDTCLKAVLKSSYGNFNILIVDDGSTDGSVGIIKNYQKNDQRIDILMNTRNLGAAASRNKAIKKAKGELIVFLDNDTEVEKRWLSELLELLMGDEQIGGAQSLLLDFEKRNLIQVAGGLLIPQVGWLAPFYHGEKYKKVKDKLRQKDIVAISAALAVKREALDKVVGFDEKEAVYTEDLDFCWRIWLTGYRMVLAPKAIVYHWTKSVRKRAGMKASYRQIYFHLAKNSFRSILKNYEPYNIVRYLPASLFVNLVRAFLVLIKRRDPSALFGTVSAVLWNLSNLPNTLRERLSVQKTRKVKDNFLLKHVFEKGTLLEIYNKHFKQTGIL